ncbi:MAG TPA: IPT/TIG domain-containing protein [Candidatus Binatia bacterium]|nr:IPT/TIG domain-containing protein [Candidatus Binatia bacterium]
MGAAPTISSLYPLGAPTGGKFRITGTDLVGITEVRIGDVSCAFAPEAPTSLLAVVPAGAEPGPVTVTTALGSASSPGNLRVVTPAKINAALQVHATNSGTGLVMLYEFPGEPALTVHESYQAGNAATARLVASATKTLNGILLAAALDDGIVLSLDEKVSDYITEWKSDPLKALITLDHLITLSSGLEAAGTLAGSDFDVAINRPISAKTATDGVGTDFVYGGDPFQVLGLYLIRRMGLQPNPQALGTTRAAQFPYGASTLPMCMAYLKARVNSRPGVWKWSAINTTPNEADPAMGGGALFTTMEFARLGQFLLNRGAQSYGGTQVISPQFVDLISTPTPYADPVPGNPGTTYGRAAWIGYAGQTPAAGTPPVSLYSAAGAGKNFAWVLPAFRMTIARHALIPQGTSMNEHEFFVALGLTDP